MVNAFSDASTDKPKGGVTEWKNPIWTIAETLKSFGQGDPVILLGVAVGGLLGLIGVVHLFRRHPTFVLIPLIHVPLTVTLLAIGSFRIWPRFFFIDAGFAILCLVHGAFVLAQAAARMLRRKSCGDEFGFRAGVVVTLVIACGFLVLLPRTYRLPKQDLLGARDFVESARSPGDAVASVGLASRVYSMYYAPDWDIVEDMKQLDQLSAKGGRTWLIYSFPKHTTATYPEIVERARADFELVKTFWGTLGDGQVLVYRSR
jgi:hypothetical protein